tara:strand:- start:489 stop:602 length:114 start_codon:yes stop_codon:yes gene_type:complete
VPEKKVVYSGGIGNQWHGKTKPDTRRKMNTNNNKGKK